MSLLTYPLTLVPPAQMLEHYMLSVKWCPVTTVSSLAGTHHHNNHTHSYGALEMADVTDSESGTPANGSNVDLYSAAGGEAHREVSFRTRCLNRLVIVLMTTVISTWIPCFGMVIALLGGFTVTILSFILPSYLHLQIVGYQNIHGSPPASPVSPLYPNESIKTSGSATSEMSPEERKSIVNTDLALTLGGVALCVVATAVTTIGFMSRVSSEGGSCT